MARILVIRFSALGDVAMTIPVLYSAALQYPQHEFVVLSREAFRDLFLHLPDNIRFYGIDLNDNRSKGFLGLGRLYADLKDLKIDLVADLHDVLRTRYLQCRFRLAGVPVAVIDKGRAGKKRLTRRKNKIMERQKTSFQRYQDVFDKLGMQVEPTFRSIFCDGKGDISSLLPLTGHKNGLKWIGIAPFAKHKGKIYPPELVERIILHFAAQPAVKVFLFGNGAEEKQVLETWERRYPEIVSLAGKTNMGQELSLMSHLDVMLSMDSANMHLASLVNTPVVSVWGATHPYAGFMGWNQPESLAVQSDLSCRPCSVFGQKPCFRGDYMCLYGLGPERIIEKVEEVLDGNSIEKSM